VISYTTEEFDQAVKRLPPDIRRKARKAYRTFLKDSGHPSLQFKKIRGSKRTWSARITDDYRAVGSRDGETIVWWWIGPHDEYEKVIAHLR